MEPALLIALIEALSSTGIQIFGAINQANKVNAQESISENDLDTLEAQCLAVIDASRIKETMLRARRALALAVPAAEPPPGGPVV